MAGGLSPPHGVPGTITLTPQTFKSIVTEYVGSLGAHGFETVLVIPSHGGNFGPLRELEAETGGRIGGARFVPYTDLLRFVEVMSEVGLADGLPAEVSESHAGEAETSILLALTPALVAMDRAVAGYDKPLDAEMAARLFEFGTTALSEVGVLGDARPATAERGGRYLDVLVDLLVGYFGQTTGTTSA
ncbi:creatininase family protein [Kribbella qitaiheensis]|uniref:creatininase family protein n=1 Tax=Kribbella qitaiheensis TaxID=1544730 RepID=UPI00361F9C02